MNTRYYVDIAYSSKEDAGRQDDSQKETVHVREVIAMTEDELYEVSTAAAGEWEKTMTFGTLDSHELYAFTAGFRTAWIQCHKNVGQRRQADTNPQPNTA